MKKILVSLALVFGALNASAFMADDNDSATAITSNSVITLHSDITVLANSKNTYLSNNCSLSTQRSSQERILRAGSKLVVEYVESAYGRNDNFDFTFIAYNVELHTNFKSGDSSTSINITCRNERSNFPTIGEFKRGIAPKMTLEIAGPVEF